MLEGGLDSTDVLGSDYERSGKKDRGSNRSIFKDRPHPRDTDFWSASQGSGESISSFNFLQWFRTWRLISGALSFSAAL
jgi:hypothetical protein